jgi:hypothetical protein
MGEIIITVEECKREIDRLDKCFAKKDLVNVNIILNKLYCEDNYKIKCLLGYYLATVMYNEGAKEILSNFFNNMEKQMNKCFPVYCASITRGAFFEINLECFEEEEPVIAYCDDCSSEVKVVSGLVYAGTAQIKRAPWMWLSETRNCVLFKAEKGVRQGKIAALLSLERGEFCTEFYHFKSDGSFILIDRNDFCLK